MRHLIAVALLLGVGTGLSVQAPAGKPTSETLLRQARAVLAPLEGELLVPGLKAEVEVLRDRWGVPHIYAQNTADLFLAQGFVAAQDRLFQLDLWRRHARGEMAEILGPDAVPADRFVRLIRYRGDMDREWESYSPDARAIAVAFTRGINAWIDQAGDKLAIEFQLLGLRPGRWQPEDVLGRMSGVYMSRNFQSEVLRAQLVAAVGVEKARWLAPADPRRDYASALAPDELKRIDRRVLAGYDAAVKLLAFQPQKTESNNWVVAGSRSASGKPLLANDPHRAIALPSLRYLVHLNAPGWNVIGAGEPALPGVAVGHNERVAWGFTIVGTDQADLFVEETNPDDPCMYKADGRWASMKVVRERLAVRGQKEPQTLELRYTRHGPVIFQDAKAHRAYALRWAGSEPGGAAYLASLAVDRARDWKSFRQALGSWKIPSLNFVYADVEGNIGWVAAAATPVRPRHDGLLPVPGDGSFEWQGFLPVTDLPQSFNPAAGFVVTANHNILPEGYRHQIGYEFAAPYRHQRLRQLLASHDRWDLKSIQALQHDVMSLPGLALARLLKAAGPPEKDLEPYARLLFDWDGRLTADAKAGPLLALWLKELEENFYAPHVPASAKAALMSLSGLPVMLQALEKPDPHWLGPDAAAGRVRLLRTTFARAVGRLKALPAPARQRWGALHQVTFRHPLANLGPAYARAFNLGPLERGGDGSTPNNTRYDATFQQMHGATYRQLFDLADWDRGLATSAPGQSGQPGSPHYDDLLPLWGRAEYFPLAFSRARVEQVTRHRLRLKPT
jgi:penicillin amidase